jgi:archaemetzincin
MSVALWWIGTAAIEDGLLEEVRRQVEAAFEFPALVWSHDERPVHAFDPRRGQHSSTQILRWLLGRKPPHAAKVLGLTDVDLFVPVLTFVYGEAQLGGEAAIVSTARLTVDSERIVNPRLFAGRLVKEAVHELGHTFGLIHCTQPICVMARSVNLPGVDAKGSRLCPDCQVRYHEFRRGRGRRT